MHPSCRRARLTEQCGRVATVGEAEMGKPLKDRIAWVFLALWCAIIAWGLSQVVRAQSELAGIHEVHGLQRSFRAPHAHTLGWVIDSQPRTLAAEFDRRYGRHHGRLNPGSWDQSSLISALKASGYVFRKGAPEAWNGMSPRFRSVDGEVHILLRKFGVQWVIFYPHVGVVLADSVPDADWEVSIIDVQEAPW